MTTIVGKRDKQLGAEHKQNRKEPDIKLKISLKQFPNEKEFKVGKKWSKKWVPEKVGNMGACARIISHTGASNGDAVTASHMTSERTSQKT